MIGQKLGSFQIEGILGSGAMGVVYRATQEPSGRTAAIKVVTGEAAGKGTMSGRFKREAEILKQFRHANIVRFLAVGRSQGVSYFAMEFVDGKTLDDVLNERGGPLPWAEMVEYGVQICEALHYAHEHGVVHRDLKPSNLMVTPQGQIKLTDFGIAKDLDATALTATGRTLGTAAYMAPEQIRGTPGISHKTDLYSLGVLFYQMLVGELPFTGPTAIVMMHAHLTQEPPRPSDKAEDIPKALDDLIIKLMAKEPSDRIWDAAAAGVVLDGLRKKKAEGRSVAMAGPSGDAALPTRLGGERLDEPVPVKKKAKARDESGPRFAISGGPWVATAGLSAALLAIVGFLTYMLLPPGASYLHDRAARLMASDKYLDWSAALDDYIDPLDARFPTHPYRTETEAWRDRIALAAAERRAIVLESPARTALSRPNTEIETAFADTSTRAAEALAAKFEPDAVVAYQALERRLRDLGEGEKVRGWVLLARRRAVEIRAAIDRRRANALDALTKILAAEVAGQSEQAARLRRGFLEKYGPYDELADLVGQVESGGKSSPEGDPSPAPQPVDAAAPPRR